MEKKECFHEDGWRYLPALHRIEDIEVPPHAKLKECLSCNAYFLFFEDKELIGEHLREIGFDIEQLKIKPICRFEKGKE